MSGQHHTKQFSTPVHNSQSSENDRQLKRDGTVPLVINPPAVTFHKTVSTVTIFKISEQVVESLSISGSTHNIIFSSIPANNLSKEMAPNMQRHLERRKSNQTLTLMTGGANVPTMYHAINTDILLLAQQIYRCANGIIEEWLIDCSTTFHFLLLFDFGDDEAAYGSILENYYHLTACLHCQELLPFI
jgi:hypothetical protein